jgi:hypothetical protein
MYDLWSDGGVAGPDWLIGVGRSRRRGEETGKARPRQVIDDSLA